MSFTDTDTLASLRDRIADFTAVKCHLYHEVARYDPTLPFPIKPPAPDEPHSNPIFCPIGQRQGRIACAHSMARNHMRRAIEKLDAGEQQMLMMELSGIEARICVLDHEMSSTAKEAAGVRAEIEERLAAGLEASPVLESDLAGLKSRMRDVSAAHDRCVEEIDRFKHKLVARLDAMLGVQVP